MKQYTNMQILKTETLYDWMKLSGWIPFRAFSFSLALFCNDKTLIS